jgi:hypothetical protein
MYCHTCCVMIILLLCFKKEVKMKFTFGDSEEDDPSIFINDGSLSSDMLTDSDDLLTQLSSDLGLSDFMDQDDNSILTDSSYERDSGGGTGTGTGNFYQQFFSTTDMPDEHALFDELIMSDGLRSSSESSESSFSVKIEPYSPQSRTISSVLTRNSFPPSPSGSESENNNFASTHFPEVITLDDTSSQMQQPSSHFDTTTPPVSPAHVTFSPSNVVTSSNVIQLAGIQCVTLPQTVQSLTTATLLNVKVPIPKITKPAPVTSFKSAPLILTSQQLAQLTQSGMLKMSTPSSSGTITTTTSSTMCRVLSPASHQMSPILIKTEPNCSPLSSGLPTMTSHTRYAVHMSSKDSDVIIIIFLLNKFTIFHFTEFNNMLKFHSLIQVQSNL